MVINAALVAEPRFEATWRLMASSIATNVSGFQYGCVNDEVGWRLVDDDTRIVLKDPIVDARLAHKCYWSAAAVHHDEWGASTPERSYYEQPPLPPSSLPPQQQQQQQYGAAAYEQQQYAEQYAEQRYSYGEEEEHYEYAGGEAEWVEEEEDYGEEEEASAEGAQKKKKKKEKRGWFAWLRRRAQPATASVPGSTPTLGKLPLRARHATASHHMLNTELGRGTTLVASTTFGTGHVVALRKDDDIIVVDLCQGMAMGFFHASSCKILDPRRFKQPHRTVRGLKPQRKNGARMVRSGEAVFPGG